MNKEDIISLNSSNLSDEQLARLLALQLLDSLSAVRTQLSGLTASGLERPGSARTRAESADLRTAQQQLLQCQSVFQQIVAYLTDADLTPAVEQQVRPAQTEGYRLLRLMAVDAMRLSAAKQPQTIESVRSQLLSQTERLQGFVQAIAESLSESAR